MLIPIAIKIAIYAIFQCNNSMFKQVLHININTFPIFLFIILCFDSWFLSYLIHGTVIVVPCLFFLSSLFFLFSLMQLFWQCLFLILLFFITTLKNHCYYFIRFNYLFSALSPDLRTNNWWNCLYSLVEDHYQRYIKNPNKSLSSSFLQKQQTAV